MKTGKFDRFLSLLLKSHKLPELPWENGKRVSIDIDTAILEINSSTGTDKIFLSDVLRGVQIFGSPGSGKTSGSGHALAKAFLKNGFGGLVLCVKNDEADLWKRYAKEANRETDLIIVSSDSNLCFNFIDDEIRRSSGRLPIQNIVKLILDVYALYSREESSRGQDSFWLDQLQTSLTHAIVITRRRQTSISLRGIVKTFRDAVDSAESENKRQTIDNRHFFEDECRKLLLEYPDDLQLKDSIEFILGEFRSLADKTRSIIVSMFRSIAEPLMQFPLEELFCGETTIVPEDAFSGKIIVIDLSVHTHRNQGLMAQLIWKMVFLNAAKHRKDVSRPIFLWCDEAQYFAEENDIQFLTTARSQKCAIVYLTQNLPNYESKLGTGAKVEAILGSLNMRIFHQNNDPKTNKWASDSIGQVRISKTSISKQGSDSLFGSSGKQTTSVSEVYENDVPARLFTNLKEGGRRNEHQVEAIVHVTGRQLSSGKTWTKVNFNQEAK